MKLTDVLPLLPDVVPARPSISLHFLPIQKLFLSHEKVNNLRLKKLLMSIVKGEEIAFSKFCKRTTVFVLLLGARKDRAG